MQKVISIRKYSILAFLFLWHVLSVSCSFGQGKNLEDAIDDLATQIAGSMISGKGNTVAVLDFNDLSGNVTVLGRFMGEELLTKLFLTKKFRVIERGLLDKALEELKFNLTELMDITKAKKLGKVVGASAIVTGTITDLGTSAKVNARVIEVESGDIIAAAGVQMAKDEVVSGMMGKMVSGMPLTQMRPEGALGSEQTRAEPPHPKVSYGAGEIFFSEDFSEYEEGDVLESWGDNLVVLKGKTGKFLSTQVEGKRVARQSVNFPRNFSFEFQFWRCFYFDLIFVNSMGDELKISCQCWAYNVCVVKFPKESEVLQESGESILGADLDKRWNDFKVTKNGKVFKVYINGTFVVTGSYSDYDFIVEFKIIFEDKKAFKGFRAIDLGEY